MPDQWELLLASLRERRASDQAALAAFLGRNLDLAAMILEPLRNRDVAMTPQRAKELADKVQAIVDAVRRLEGFIREPREWQNVHERTDRVEAELAHACGWRDAGEGAGFSPGRSE
jgi:hypothetical protein